MKEKGLKKGGEILSEGKSQTESGQKRTNASMINPKTVGLMGKLGQFWEQPSIQTQQEKNPCVKSQRCQLPQGAKNGQSEDVSEIENAQNMGFSFQFFLIITKIRANE